MKIFLSHASESKPLVRRLTEPLPPHVSMWLDRDMMGPGQRFGSRIQAAIDRECDFVLVFIDEHALASDWVRRETALALERQVALQRTYVLPVLLQPVGARMKELGIDPEDMLYLDATDASESGIAAAARTLGEELFKHCSVLIEALRNADRRRFIDDLAADLTEFSRSPSCGGHRWATASRCCRPTRPRSITCATAWRLTTGLPIASFRASRCIATASPRHGATSAACARTSVI